MKRCQKCSRTYPDENQKFCTFDGGLLLHEQPPALTFDPNLTVRATSSDLTPPPNTTEASEAPTSVQLPNLDRTIASFGTGPFGDSETTPTGRQTADNLVAPAAAETINLSSVPVQPPPSTPLPEVPTAAPPPAEVPIATAPPPPEATAAQLTATPTPVPPATTQKRSILPWVLVGLVALLLIGGGAAGAGYFFWLKPFLEARKTKPPVVLPSRTPDQNPNGNPNATPTPDTSASNTPTPEQEAFVPPAGAVKFTNSKENLDGKLAEHYLDFSLYYLESWERDPKAGVPGASNFVRVGRKGANGVPQEDCAVGWYNSKGTFDLDKDDFPKRVEELNSSYLSRFSNYRKVSEGPTKVNSLDAYEFRFEATGEGDLKIWGRVIFLPRGIEGEKNGLTILLLTTSLAPELTSVDDVGIKGELPIVLKSFRFGAGR